MSRFLTTLALVTVALPSLPAQDGKSVQHAGTTIQRPGSEYGSELPGKALGIGSTMDVAIMEDLVYAIGNGQLTVMPGARSAQPVPLGKLRGLGNTRQIAVSRGHAFITAREDGMFIVDVRDPAQPKIVNHYDTAELGTAIAVSGDVAAVGNRFAGIELLDVSQPSSPRHFSTIRAGEVQSLVFHGSWLYAGTWANKAVAVIDVANPWQPRLATTIPLDGNGDGLDVAGNLLAVATGHHAKSKAYPKPGDAAFGHGHGIEFFDIANPAEPRRISGLKFPPFYRLGMDMWGVVLAGGHAFVNDTHNGFFLIDVRDPEKPRFIGWRQLPLVKGDPSPVAGLAVARGRVFLAGGFDDLHLVETGLAEAEPAMPQGGLRVPVQPSAQANGLHPSYQANGSIRAVVPWRDEMMLVAAGSAGLHVLRLTTGGFEKVAEYPTNGFARDVAVHRDVVCVAESLGGLSMWRAQPDGTLRRTGAYTVPGKSIHQVVLADGGNVAFVAVGPNILHVIKFGEEGRAERILEEKHSGLFYREPFAPDGNRFLAQWHITGLYQYTAEHGQAQFTGYQFPHQMGTECGAAPWRDGWIATSNRGFFFLNPGETRTPEQIGLLRVGGRALPGKPSVHGQILFIADPFLGDVSAIDLADPGQPRELGRLQLSGHPGRVRGFKDKALVPAGRQGLLLWDYAAR